MGAKDAPGHDCLAGLEDAISEAGAALAARLDAVPDPAEMPNDTVLFVRRQFSEPGTSYSYAYVKAAGFWYGTGAQHRALHDQPWDDRTFRHMLAVPEVREISMVTSWEVLSGAPLPDDDES